VRLCGYPSRMRTRFVALLIVLVTFPAVAQNVDIESLSGLQFNFGNPGARALGMGGAFLGLADDASAAEANPAGLTILRKAEISLEARNYAESQLFSTSGTFPDVVRTEFTHHSDAAVITFGSFVYPIKNKFTLGVYYHEPLHNQGGGFVVPERNDFTGLIETRTPNFFLPVGGGGALTEAQCLQMNRTNPGSCVEYRIDPFVSALDVRQQTWGFAAAWQVHPKFSIGATARYQTFEEAAFTFRFAQPEDGFFPKSISVQTTGTANGTQIEVEKEADLTFTGGFKWTANDKFSLGGVYKQGPRYDTPTFAAAEVTNWEYVLLAETTFHIPDIAGIGVSFRPRPELTINLDAVHVKYSNLVDDFQPTITDSADAGSSFVVDDVVELHIGAEYFFPTKIPFAIRAGYWRDPAHSIEWRGPLDQFPDYAEALLFPTGETQNHISIGAGLAWSRFQIDAAYDTSDMWKAGSISFVTRF
jgi:long-chain fatty acid transport protein